MRLPIAAGVMVLLLFACQKSSPEETLVKSTDKAAAWLPALQMIGEKWIANSVPANFVNNAADAAEKDFAAADDDISKSTASPALRERLRDDLAAGRRFARALRSAIDRDNPRLIAPELPTLAKPSRDLEEIQDRYRGSA